MGAHGPGTRGVRKEGPFEPPTPLAGHMPAKEPTKQEDFGPSSKRGTHESDFSGNSTRKPKEQDPGIDDSGTSDFEANAQQNLVAGKHDPRRSHS